MNMAKNARTKENVVTFKLAIAIGCGLALCTGCKNPGYVKPPNATPEAVAKVVDPSTNMAVETMITIPFSGAPVAVAFDGSASFDKDGTIKEWRWSAGDPNNPAMRVLSAPPNTSPRATLMLGQGSWTVSLWVTDSMNRVSLPDTVKLVVGMPSTPPAGGAGGAGGGAGGAAAPAMVTEAMCLTDTVASVPMPCKACLCSKDCRNTVVASQCDETCWALLRCIAMKCPTFAMDMNTTCLLGMCGAEVTAYMGGKTPMGAMPAGACARMCPTECSSMM
jgi:hypothetical protein